MDMDDDVKRLNAIVERMVEDSSEIRNLIQKICILAGINNEPPTTAAMVFLTLFPVLDNIENAKKFFIDLGEKKYKTWGNFKPEGGDWIKV